MAIEREASIGILISASQGIAITLEVLSRTLASEVSRLPLRERQATYLYLCSASLLHLHSTMEDYSHIFKSAVGL
jgi:hypothetical protein